MSRIRSKGPVAEPRQPDPAVLAGAQAVLRRPSWSPRRLAYWLLLDPVLCAKAFGAWAATAQAVRSAASPEAGLEQVGRPLLTALIHGFSSTPVAVDKLAATRWEGALSTAAVARRLAVAIGYGKPGEAYLAGLWRDFNADTVTDFGVSPFVAAAVRFRQTPLAELASAHPLVRIAGAASWATDLADSWRAAEEATAAIELVGLPELIGLPPDALIAEALRGRRWAQQVTARLRRAPAPAPRGAIHDGIASIARLHALQEAWFFIETPEELQAHIVRSARVLFDCTHALLLMPDPDGRQLRAAVEGVGPAEAAEMALDLRLQSSRLAAAFRARGSMTIVKASTIGLPVVDRQIIGLLEADSALCLPLAAPDGVPTALLMLGWQDGQADDETANRFAAFAGMALAACHRRVERERRRLDEQQDALRRHVRQVGHEIGNVLSVVKNTLAVLDEPRAVVKDIDADIDRATALLQQLSRPAASAAIGPVDVNQLVRELLAQLSGGMFAARNIASAAELDPGMPAIVTDAAAVRRVLLNLCRNAAEAMSDGGRLQLATTARVNLAGRLFAEVVVRDSGPGIGAGRMARVFHEVSSTKGAGHEGIGLAIARSSMARLGGEVAFRNARDGGAEFSILIPWQPSDVAASGTTSEGI